MPPPVRGRVHPAGWPGRGRRVARGGACVDIRPEGRPYLQVDVDPKGDISAPAAAARAEMSSRRRWQDDFEAEIESHLQSGRGSAPSPEACRSMESAGEPPAGTSATETAARERFYQVRSQSLWADRLRRRTCAMARAPSAGVPPSPPSRHAVARASASAPTPPSSVCLNALLLRPYPFPDLDWLVTVCASVTPSRGARRASGLPTRAIPLAPADFLDLRPQGRSFVGYGRLPLARLHAGGQGEPERLAGRLVSPQLFTLLRVERAPGPHTAARGSGGRPGRIRGR